VSECTNIEIGRLLHDYELDMLSAEDKHRFEMHLYDCDHCLSQARGFLDVSRIMRHDRDARAVIQNISGELNHTETEGVRKKPTPFIRYLLAAAIVMMIAVSAYWYSKRTETPSAMQSLELLSSRGGGSDIIYLQKGGDVEISFYVAENFEGEADLTISSIDGDTVFYVPGFSDFNDRGLGSITLPVSDFSDGHYMLTIKPNQETGIEERVYMFRVK